MSGQPRRAEVLARISGLSRRLRSMHTRTAAGHWVKPTETRFFRFDQLIHRNRYESLFSHFSGSDHRVAHAPLACLLWTASYFSQAEHWPSLEPTLVAHSFNKKGKLVSNKGWCRSDYHREQIGQSERSEYLQLATRQSDRNARRCLGPPTYRVLR